MSSPTRSRRPSVFLLLRHLLRHSRRLLILYLVTGTLTGFANIGLLALINATLAGETERALLPWSFLGVGLLLAATRTGSDLILISMGESSIAALRISLAQQVLAVPLRRLEEIGPHRTLSTLTEDINTISTVIKMLPILTFNATLLIGALFYLAWLSRLAFVALLVLLAIGILSYRIPISRAFHLMKRARELNDVLFQHFRALTDGAKELRQHRRRRQRFMEDDFQSTVGEVQRQNLKSGRILALTTAWGQLLLFLVVGLVLFVLPRFIETTTEMLTGYTMTLLYLMTPLQNLMDSTRPINRASVALHRIEKMDLDLAIPKGALTGDGGPEMAAWRRLELVGVSHVFQREDHEGEFVLGPIDLQLEPGELVFIAGGNGSGKTTLGKILTGLYAPNEGDIRLDDLPITDANRDGYRQLFSAVFFDFYLFQNLLGLERTDLDGDAAELLARLQLTKKVRVSQGQLSTTELSQGQRKRLALLTALLEDRPIYLFDEWAADQDPRFKEIFYRVLLPKLKSAGKTAIVITHDDRYFGLADRLLKLEDGQIVTEVPRSVAGRPVSTSPPRAAAPQPGSPLTPRQP